MTREREGVKVKTLKHDTLAVGAVAGSGSAGAIAATATGSGSTGM